MLAPIGGRVSRHLVSVGNLVQGSEGGSTLLTSIVSLDPIYIYFDVDEATYLKNSRLWFEGRRPSSRDTPNPVQVSLGIGNDAGMTSVKAHFDRDHWGRKDWADRWH